MSKKKRGKAKAAEQKGRGVYGDDAPFKLRDFVRLNLTKLDQNNKDQCELARMIVNS